MRRVYPLQVTVNGRSLSEIVIDDHYQKRHAESIDDLLILRLVRKLHSGRFEPESVTDSGFEYYRTEPMVLEGKPYRLVWTLHPDEHYLGVVNCYRRKRNAK